jgi:hypothetical protein
MEKKYQVFVSSTFTDLVEERQEVIQALLEQDCIPVGMEMFPAADDDQWTIIQRLIDDCDYYILIVGGRYGSMSQSGQSYTQMEYEYALKKQVPSISFLPKNPENISVSKSDIEPDSREKLAIFKNLVQQKLCKFYESPKDLGSVVSRSLIKLIKDKPRPGWVRATFLPSEETTLEILELTKTVSKLKQEIISLESNIKTDNQQLSQGLDVVDFRFISTNRKHLTINKFYKVSMSWDEIFSELSPHLIEECSENEMSKIISQYGRNKCRLEIVKQYGLQYCNVDFNIDPGDFQTIKIQLRALNLITQKIRKHLDNDSEKYWNLTPAGDIELLRLKAILKS